MGEHILCPRCTPSPSVDLRGRCAAPGRNKPPVAPMVGQHGRWASVPPLPEAHFGLGSSQHPWSWVGLFILFVDRLLQRQTPCSYDGSASSVFISVVRE